MELDDDICYCYHVPLRKLQNYAKRTQPQRPSQMTGCLGAGTGCGWCIPILMKIFDECRDGQDLSADVVDMTPEEYAAEALHDARWVPPLLPNLGFTGVLLL